MCTRMKSLKPSSGRRYNVAVFIFHDWAANATIMKNIAQLDRLADENGFIALYPEGIDRSWNGGGCCGTASEDNVDEVGFVRQMLVDLENKVTVDPKRIYATGFGTGGTMAYRLACEMSDTFAAIAPVNGGLWYPSCQPETPVSVLHLHGLDNTISPYAGGKSEVSVEFPEPVGGWDFPSVEQGITTWVQLNGCTGTSTREQQDKITYSTYESCQDGAAVQLVTIDGFGYGWPNSAFTPSFTAKNIWRIW